MHDLTGRQSHCAAELQHACTVSEPCQAISVMLIKSPSQCDMLDSLTKRDLSPDNEHLPCSRRIAQVVAVT